MSWAARRKTTRREDIAYCLMGIFDVNMPFLYGEGDKAFQRLQEEIMKQPDDQSIFLWTDPTGDKYCYRSLLARHPSEFAGCQSIEFLSSNRTEPHAMTTTGIRMSARLLPLTSSILKELVPDETISCCDDSFLPDFACYAFEGSYQSFILRDWNLANRTSPEFAPIGV